MNIIYAKHIKPIINEVNRKIDTPEVIGGTTLSTLPSTKLLIIKKLKYKKITFSLKLARIFYYHILS